MLRGPAIWVLIMLIETAHGVLRGLLLVPLTGERMAGLIGWPVGAVIVMAVSLLTIRWSGLARRAELLRLGGVWALLTGCFEIAIGLLRGLDAQGLWNEINPLSGGLMVYSLVLMAVAPLMAARLRGIGPAG